MVDRGFSVIGNTTFEILQAIHLMKALGLLFMSVTFHEAMLTLEVTGGNFIQ